MRRLMSLAALALSVGAAHAEDATPKAHDGMTYARHLASVARSGRPAVSGVEVLAGTPPHLVGTSPAPAPAGTKLHRPLHNVSGDVIGELVITFASGAAKPAAVDAIDQFIARRTLSAKNLADPYPYDPRFRSDTRAQALVDATMHAHSDLLVFAIHATPPGGTTNVIIGSNIGRIGKAADEDDLRVIDKGSTNLEVSEGGERFEVELPLNDASGKRIGALGTVFAYHAGADKEALHAHAIAIRDELSRKIADPASLFSPLR